MTVKELIEQLQRAPQDVLVEVYGSTYLDGIEVIYEMEDGQVNVVVLQ